MTSGEISNYRAKKARNLGASAFFCILLLASLSRAERLPVKTYTVAEALLRDEVTYPPGFARFFMVLHGGRNLAF